MNLNDAVLCCALAWRMHGTEEAVRAACFRCRTKVNRECQPLLSKVMRHPYILDWLALVMGWPALATSH